jgi:hypothetical protein
MNEEEKNKIVAKYQEKWSSILNLESGSTKSNWFEKYASNEYVASIDPATDNFDSISFPIVRRVMASTLGGGGWKKSKIQQLKEDRLNKLLKLKGEEPNVTLPNDEYVEGLVKVTPISSPKIDLGYVNYYYKNDEKNDINSNY